MTISEEGLKLPHALVGVFFGGIAGLLAGGANLQFSGLAIPLLLYGEEIFLMIVVVIVAPVVEETSKLLGSLWLLKEEGVMLTLRGWAILGTTIGLGFGLMENVVYSTSVFEYGLDTSLLLFLIRLFVSVPVHMAATTISGFGVGVWSRTNAPAKFLGYFAIAVVIHSLHNLLVSVG